MPTAATLETLATKIVQAQDNRTELKTLASSGQQLSMREAYQVSWLVHEARLKSGWRPIGRKIGFTNPDLWLMFGVTHPVWSYVYDQTVEAIGPDTRYALSNLVQPRIEPEIVLCLHTAPPIGASENDVLDCIEWFAHGIEMVQCHYPDWKFTSNDAVCDSSFHARLLIGPKQWVRHDRAAVGSMLKDFAVGLYRNDDLIELGHGKNVLGSPVLAILGLVEAIQHDGAQYPILSGEIITTGSLTKAYPVNVGERWRTEFKQNQFAGLTITFV